MRKIETGILALGLLFVTQGCEQAPSNSVSKDGAAEAVANTTQAPQSADGSRLKADRAKGSPAKDTAPTVDWLPKRPTMRIAGDLVEDDVPAAAYPLIEQEIKLADRCFELKNDALCQASYKIDDQLKAQNICRGRWSDPLDSDDHRIPSWHICDSESLQNNE